MSNKNNVSLCDICGKEAETLAYHALTNKWCCITCIALATNIERSESEYPGVEHCEPHWNHYEKNT